MDAFDMLSRRRWSGSGLVLLVILCALLAYPLWRARGVSHPLAGAQHLDVCALLPSPTLPAEARAKPIDSNGNLACLYRPDDPTQPDMFVTTLITTRTLSVDGAQSTSRMFDTWVKETKASGAQDMRDETGPWAAAASWRMGNQNSFLFEDHGVMVALQSALMSTQDLGYYARHAAETLRTGTPVSAASSAAVASPPR